MNEFLFGDWSIGEISEDPLLIAREKRKKDEGRRKRMELVQKLRRQKDSQEEKPVITADYETAVEVAKTAVSMLHEKRFPFDNPETLPDRIIPESVSSVNDMELRAREHANFILLACSLDSNAEARILYRRVRRMVDEAGGMERFFALSSIERKELTIKYLGQVAISNPLEAIEQNKSILFRDYEGDAKNIFHGGDFRNHITRLIGFRLVREGKAALILKNMLREGYAHLDDDFDFPIKVDRHALKIAIGTRVVEIKPEGVIINKWATPVIGRVFREVTRKERISPADLNDALYGIGSNLCVRDDESYCREHCVVNPTCRVRPSSDHYSSYLDTSKDSRKPSERTLFD